MTPSYTLPNDPIATPPALEGPYGRAWRLEPGARVDDGKPHAFVALWIVEAPWAHKFWHSYMLATIHLRPLAGVAPPVVVEFGATHEISLYALDPSHPRGPAIAEHQAIRLLYPPNYVGQFKSDGDAYAAGRAEQTVREICEGLLSPDTDFRSEWVRRFGHVSLGETVH